MPNASQTMPRMMRDKTRHQLLIRPLATGDASALDQFFASLSATAVKNFQPHPFTHSFVKKMTHDAASSSHLRMLALDPQDHQRVVGYAFITKLPLLPYGYFGIAVTDAYQGRGISSILMNQLFAYAVTKHVKTVYLNVYQDNLIARKSYLKQGFRETHPPQLFSKIFTFFELWYNQSLHEVWQPKSLNTAPAKTSVWMVKTLAITDLQSPS